jgi:hypothetical protein
VGGGAGGEHSPLVRAIAVASQERLRELVATLNVLLQRAVQLCMASWEFWNLSV